MENTAILNSELKLTAMDTCFKYSEDKEALKSLMAEIKVRTKVIGKDFYFDGDKEERLILRVYIERGKEEISFRFGMSINDTEIFHAIPGHDFPSADKTKARRLVKSKLLYSLLSCISSDYYCPETFDDFCNEFGYDSDSRKAERLFEKCREQSAQLKKIFTEKEIECLPR